MQTNVGMVITLVTCFFSLNIAFGIESVLTGSRQKVKVGDYTQHFVITYKEKHVIQMLLHLGFPGGASGKEPACQYRRPGFDPWVRKIPRKEKGERNSNLLQCSCLENPIDREAWSATVHGVTMNQTLLKQLTIRKKYLKNGYIYMFIHV